VCVRVCVRGSRSTRTWTLHGCIARHGCLHALACARARALSHTHTHAPSPQSYEVFTFEGPGVGLAMYNTDDSIKGFARVRGHESRVMQRSAMQICKRSAASQL
jgi:isocitrate dehydrogenase